MLSSFAPTGTASHSGTRTLRDWMRPRFFFIVLVALAVFVRLGALLFTLGHAGVEAIVYSDSIDYLKLASSLYSGDGFVRTWDGMGDTLVPETFRTPGLPLLLAPFSPYGEKGLVAYAALLAVISGVLLPLLTYAVGKRLVPEAGARIAAALVAFEPHLVFFSFVLLTEIPFTLCMLGGFLLVLKAAERNAAPLAIVGGALLGYSILIRPGFFPVFLLSGIGTLGVLFFLKDWGRLRVVALTCSAVLVLLAPWAARMHEVTGVVALSGAGWRNVYTDYVASVRAVEKKTAFHEEKAILEARVGELGFSRVELNSPVSASALRSFSLDELWEHRGTVLKLESALLASFFLHDGYFYEFIRFGFLTERGEGHIPVTFTLLSRGVAGVPAIFEELARQRFIPVLGRLFTLMIFVGMVFGFAVTRDRLRFLLAGVIILSAIAATAIGLGVESRSRLPFEPFMFIFTGAAVAYIMNRTQRHAS